MRIDRYSVLTAAVGLFVGLIVLVGAPTRTIAEALPAQIADSEFWRMISDFSEPGGSFRFQFTSNEREFPTLISELKTSTKPGGVYLGVGPEQNFSYISALQPRIAFVLDIRRDNVLEHLIYKAIFEMSSNRVDFLSRLFSRKPPAGLNDRSTAGALFQAFGTTTSDPRLFDQNLQAVRDRLIKSHRFPLTPVDLEIIETIYRRFFAAGPGVSNSPGNFGRRSSPTYAELMTATDEHGEARSYLASEENYRFVRDLQQKNLVVPLVGNFAGAKAIRAVAQYLKDHQATVTAFYASNVEQYLFEQNDD